MELIGRLEKRAKAGLSNPAEVTPELLSAAIVEANEIVGNKDVGDTVKLDIANFRLMLMLKKNGVDEEDLDLYKEALKSVKSASSIEIKGEITPASFVKIGQRENIWG
ncbi:hypothetical protein [Arcobacter sp.]|uniref:hypothetical protein n=1 Tax=unclassified Arcobacter TaxID=2593671 RepID=UPI003AFFAA43